MNNKKIILNLTQHKASAEQIREGVIDLPEKFKGRLVELLTFNEIPSPKEIEKRATEIYDLVIDFCIDANSPIREEVEGMIDWDLTGPNGYVLKDEGDFEKLGISFMIGGAPWLMKPLIEELQYIGEVVFAFTKREVVEEEGENGEIIKKSVFKHAGFVPAV